MSKCSKVFCGLVMFLALCSSNNQKYAIAFNNDKSLGGKIYWIKKDVKEIKRDDLLAFNLKNNPRVKESVMIIKIVGGIGGDEINERDGVFSNAKGIIGCAKHKDKTGVEVKAMNGRIEVPNNKYFVYGEHGDSYDSKYEEFGFVGSDDVIGLAYELL
jgi:type IV secretory pathway protease TraF